MNPKPHQPFASSGSADAPTRKLAADSNPSSQRFGPNSGAVKGTADPLPVEADRKPAGSLQHLPAVIERAERDFQSDKDWIFAATEFIVDCDPSPLMMAYYNRTYMNLWLKCIGREDLILDLSAGEVD